MKVDGGLPSGLGAVPRCIRELEEAGFAAALTAETGREGEPLRFLGEVVGRIGPSSAFSTRRRSATILPRCPRTEPERPAPREDPQG